MSFLSVAVITLNEAHNLPACLGGVSWADELVVVDSGSADDTVAVARQLGARVVTRPFTDYSGQKNFAFAQCSGDWLLSLDADEQVSPDLAREIKAVLANPGEYEAFDMPRLNLLLGRWMRYGLVWRERKLRLVRRGRGQWHGTVHEVLTVSGPIGHLRSPLLHYGNDDVRDVARKINHYTTLEAEAWQAAGVRPSLWKMALYPPALFLYAYVARLGALDGSPGFIHAVLMAYNSFLKRAKLWELSRPARQQAAEDTPPS